MEERMEAELFKFKKPRFIKYYLYFVSIDKITFACK